MAFILHERSAKRGTGCITPPEPSESGMMSVYPEKIARLINSPLNGGRLSSPSAAGLAATLVCGSAVRFELDVSSPDRKLDNIKFQTNGCGFAVAAAELIAQELSGRSIEDFDSHWSTELLSKLSAELAPVPAMRQHCLELAVDALRECLADYRRRTVEAYEGDDALVCSCFGVGEEKILAVIEDGAENVSDVTAMCRAGGGCGSCRMVIEELLA